MKRIFFIVLLLGSGIVSYAQLYQSAMYVGWNVVAPLSDKEYTSKTSAAGMKMGFTKFVGDRFGFGLEGSYNMFNDYVPLRTYDFPGGAISTDVYNYLYHFSVLATGQYYFIQGGKFIPYASLGMGAVFSEYHIYYNTFQDQDNKTGFVIRPEVGTFFRVKEYSRWGLKSSISYDYATNGSENFDIKNFSGISFQLGLVFFTE